MSNFTTKLFQFQDHKKVELDKICMDCVDVGVKKTDVACLFLIKAHYVKELYLICNMEDAIDTVLHIKERTLKHRQSKTMVNAVLSKLKESIMKERDSYSNTPEGITAFFDKMRRNINAKYYILDPEIVVIDMKTVSSICYRVYADVERFPYSTLYDIDFIKEGYYFER